MKKDFQSSDEFSSGNERIHRLTAFTAEKKEYGLQIRVAGCVKLMPSVNMPEYVVGTIELSDQLVPVIDFKAKTGREPSELTAQSCIVLFEHHIGNTTIVTGRLFDSACEVFDLIADYMELPDRHEKLYSCPEDAVIMTETAKQ